MFVSSDFCSRSSNIATFEVYKESFYNRKYKACSMLSSLYVHTHIPHCNRCAAIFSFRTGCNEFKSVILANFYSASSDKAKWSTRQSFLKGSLIYAYFCVKLIARCKIYVGRKKFVQTSFRNIYWKLYLHSIKSCRVPVRILRSYWRVNWTDNEEISTDSTWVKNFLRALIT